MRKRTRIEPRDEEEDGRGRCIDEEEEEGDILMTTENRIQSE